MQPSVDEFVEAGPHAISYASRTLRPSVFPQTRREKLGLACCILVAFACALAAGFKEIKSLFRTTECTKENQAKAELFMLSTQLKAYRHRYATYPADLQFLQNESTVATNQRETVVSGPFVSSDSELSDPWGRPWSYAVGPMIRNRSKFDLWSAGPDGISGNADDITNLP